VGESDDDLLPACMLCRSNVPTTFVSYSETRGEVFRRRERFFDGRLCFNCLGIVFWRYTQNTLLLGWFSPFSAFLTPVYAVQNAYSYLKARRALLRELADPAASVRPV
jgi:hypothetical protein